MKAYRPAKLLEDCELLENRTLAPRLNLLRLRSHMIAPLVQPGQFVHVRIPLAGELPLRRPFSVYDVGTGGTELFLVYQVVGTGTQHIQALKPPITLNLLGPCGRGWQLPPAVASEHSKGATGRGRVLLVGGGIGTAALSMLARQLLAGFTVDFVIGTARAELMIYKADLAPWNGVDGALTLHICTDDGSLGRLGLTTDLAAELLRENPYVWMASCGPRPMLAALAKLARTYGLKHQVSMEERMACGLGTCLGCSLPTRDGQRQVCVDGPVFDAEELLWT
ncbi:MAG: dihydroorotate dehydrogenase electron transfer subunit [Coriobacteriales bacterium]|jgi:dihydroorotate dehydrogenase electron transfer subunit|nr:dihydroorotate dehydrogenase electron transfer subunit [Coriobacteriales bacterium]